MARKSYRRVGSPVRVNMRLRRIGAATQPGDTEVWTVLGAVGDTGRVPKGWEVAAVDWQAYHARSDSYSGWRRGDVRDLKALLAPVFAGDLIRLGWEPRLRTIHHIEEVAWERFRLAAGARSTRYRPGEWVSDAYAARYPGKVTGHRGTRRVEYDETVTDYEAEVRVDYEP